MLRKNVSKKKAGQPPGTAVYTGSRDRETTISIIRYSATSFSFRQGLNLDEVAPLLESPSLCWFDICGLRDVSTIEELGRFFGLHPLTVEDILNVRQRPKLENFEDYLYITLRMFRVGKENGELETEQVSIILGSNFVATFHEVEGNDFDPVRNRIEAGRGRIRNMGPDYLAYSLIDSVVDSYFGVVEALGDRIEDLQDELIENPVPETLGGINRLKRDIMYIRRSSWPLRELASSLERVDSELMDEGIDKYLRDLYDHVIQILDAVETLRELATGMLEIYLSSISNKMNEVMKVLTIIATIFIPLTFIAGIYGMNFEYMPELGWKWAYFGVLGFMAATAVGMVCFFRRKKWL